MSEDPIGFAGQDVNLYRYVGNNPLMTTDPSGNAPLIPVVIGVWMAYKYFYEIRSASPLKQENRIKLNPTPLDQYNPTEHPKVQKPFPSIEMNDPNLNNIENEEQKKRKKEANKDFRNSCS